MAKRRGDVDLDGGLRLHVAAVNVSSFVTSDKRRRMVRNSERKALRLGCQGWCRDVRRDDTELGRCVDGIGRLQAAGFLIFLTGEDVWNGNAFDCMIGYV